jgi:chromosome segregation ATPase
MDPLNPDELVENLRAAISEQSSRAIEGHNSITEKLAELQGLLSALTETEAAERATCHSLAGISQEQLKMLDENMPEPMSQEDMQRLASADKRLVEKDEKIEATTARIADLESSAAEKDETVTALRSRVSELEQEAEGLKAATQAARHRTEQLEKSAAETSEVSDAALLRATELEKALGEKADATEAARGRVVQLEKEIQSLRGQVDSAADDGEFEAANQRVEVLESEIGALRDEAAQLKKALESASVTEEEVEQSRKLLQIEKERADGLQSMLDEERGDSTKSMLAQQLAEALRLGEETQEELLTLRQELAQQRDTDNVGEAKPDTQERIRAAASATGDDARRKMGDILVDAGVITAEQLEIALAKQRASENTRLGAILVDLRIASEDVVAQTLAYQRNVDFVRIKNDTVQREAANLISGRLAEHHGCLPISALNQRLTLAMVNPLDLIAIEDVERATDHIVEPVVATPSEIFSAIKEVYAS